MAARPQRRGRAALAPGDRHRGRVRESSSRGRHADTGGVSDIVRHLRRSDVDSWRRRSCSPRRSETPPISFGPTTTSPRSEARRRDRRLPSRCLGEGHELALRSGMVANAGWIAGSQGDSHSFSAACEESEQLPAPQSLDLARRVGDEPLTGQRLGSLVVACVARSTRQGRSPFATRRYRSSRPTRSRRRPTSFPRSKATSRSLARIGPSRRRSSPKRPGSPAHTARTINPHGSSTSASGRSCWPPTQPVLRRSATSMPQPTPSRAGSRAQHCRAARDRSGASRGIAAGGDRRVRAPRDAHVRSPAPWSTWPGR